MSSGMLSPPLRSRTWATMRYVYRALRVYAVRKSKTCAGVDKYLEPGTWDF